MRWLGLVFCLAVAAFGCDETFESPPLPDLYKDPYDFGIPGRDGGSEDLAVPDGMAEKPDLTGDSHPDLSDVPDLTPLPDM
jgi:hypothetical protein